jgi:phosphatidylserine/phosphatidylglycerophosphate/cardiolipin synthase-like enzyme
MRPVEAPTVRRTWVALSVLALLLLGATAARAQPLASQERLCDPSFQDCREDILQYIAQEQVGIDVGFWMMNDARYSNALVAAWNRGVRIRLLMDPRCLDQHAHCEGPMDQLAAAGLPMRRRAIGGILHWKMFIFAGQRQVEFSGANLAPFELTPETPYVNYTDEVVYFTNEASVVSSFMTKFDDLWTSPSEFADYANINGPLLRSYPTTAIDPDLNFPPDDSYRSRAIYNYNREPQKIDVFMFRITDVQHTNAMVAAVNRGIPVRLLTDESEYRNPNRLWDAYNVDIMHHAGVQVRLDAHQGINHEKAVILYGLGMSIFGSSNWTSPSTDSQREHNYFTTKPWILQWLSAQFERKWNNSAGFAETKAFVPLPPGVPAYVSPANGATAQPVAATTLTWDGGLWGQIYDIYLGTTPNPPLFAANQQLGPSQYGGDNRTFALPTLEPGTTYYWKIVSKTMAYVATSGPVWSFKTGGSPPPPPLRPSTGAASGVTQTGATLNGTANPNGVSVTARFEYGFSTAYGSSTAAVSLGSGTANVAIGAGGITGLTCGSLYHFRATATNAGGTTNGVDATFTTAACSPPGIVAQPQGGTIGAGQTATLTVAATGSPTLTYQWYIGNSGATANPIAGATSTTYTTPPLSSTTSYWVRVRNAQGTADSTAAIVTVTPCTFSLSPSSASPGAEATTGSATLTASNPACTWSAVSQSGFVAVTSPASGAGTSTLTWQVTGNRITSTRVGTIAVAGLTFTITQAGALVGHAVPNDFNRDGVPDLGIFSPSAGRWLIDGQPPTDFGTAGDLPVAGDFNGDGSPDIAVFRPSTGTWYIKGGSPVLWGAAGDIPAPGDYNGDGTTDIAVFRPSTGTFFIRNGDTVAWGLPGDLPVVGDYNADGLDDVAVFRPATGMWYVRNVLSVPFGVAADVPVPADYNGDGRTDIAVFRPSTGSWLVKDLYTQVWGASGDVPVPLDRNGDGIVELGLFRRATGMWYFKNHATSATESVALGGPGDVPLNRATPTLQTQFGDYDGDRKADLTVFRPSTGDWVSLRSLSGMSDYTARSFGLNGDVPVARDYDGDGQMDFAVYRPSAGRWYVLQSSTNSTSYVFRDWGMSGDVPVPGDYDGDGRADFAVFRPSLGRWLILLSSTGNTSYTTSDWGQSGDVPVPADYDGDGRTDLAVFRPSVGRWLILNRITGATATRDWGLNGDAPAAADFDGDGKSDIAVFRPSLGRWFILSSIDGGFQVVDWGLSGDVLVPADYNGDGKADIAVFRPSTGTWYVRGQFNRSWGLSADIPALKNP